MRTPDEIKKGLEVFSRMSCTGMSCNPGNCPYAGLEICDDETCGEYMARDALEYIRQLETRLEATDE